MARPLARQAGSPVSRRAVLRGAGGLAFGLSFSVGADVVVRRADAMTAGGVRSVWVTIDPDGAIRIMSPAAEMGQGSLTSLPLIIADEMDADWARVAVEMAPPSDALYGNPYFHGLMMTAGSSSVASYFTPIRLQAAQVRRLLIDSAAARWGVPGGEISTTAGRAVHAASGRQMTYGEIAAQFEMPRVLPQVTEKDLKPQGSYRYIGKDVLRVDLPSKVDGSAVYSIDVQLPDMLYGAVVRAPVEGGAPAAIDDRDARVVPGVIDVVPLPYGAGVIAKSYEAALAAKQRLQITWTQVKGADAFDSDTVLDRYAAAARDLTPPGGVWDKKGDVAAAEAQAKTFIEADYRTDFFYHGQMEPLNAVAAVSPKGDRADIWAGTQSPTLAVAATAKALGIPPERVTLHRTLLGGGFGRRGHRDQEFVIDAVLLSKAVHRPVKMIWTREDDVRNGRFRPMTAHHLRAGLDASGNVALWRHRVSSDEALAFQDPVRFEAAGRRAVFAMLGTEQPSYDLPNRLIDHVRQVDIVRLSSMRGTGNPPNAFVVESFIDEIAARLGEDPVQFRLRLLKHEPRGQAVVRMVARMADWGRPRPAGRGLGISFKNHAGTLDAAVAEASVDRASGDITVHSVWAAVDPGLAVQPDMIAAQIEGAIVYGLGMMTRERITIRKGAVEQSNFYDYQVARMADLPEIEVKVLSTTAKPTGIGEMGVELTAAIANAVAAAIGVRLRHLPLTSERVLAALKA